MMILIIIIIKIQFQLSFYTFYRYRVLGECITTLLTQANNCI